MTDLTPDEPSAAGQGDGGPSNPSSADEDGKSRSAAPIWPKKRLQTSGGRRAGDAVVATLTRWGLVPHTYVMTTIGRKTGTPRSTPVTLVEKGERRWLVAPYGPVSWVLNARAAGRVTIGRRGRAQDFTIEELSAEQAGPILQQYLKIAGATRPYFEATKASPVADFVAEASRHPVFELTAVTDLQGTGGGAVQ